MAITPTPSTRRGPSTAARRLGYLGAIAGNAVLLWVAHRLLVWGWPAFLTGEFAQVLPLVTASLIVSMMVNAVFVLRDRGRVKALGDLVNAGVGLAVAVRMWTVFPFDFSGYGTDWAWAVRVALAVGIVATSIGALVNLIKLVAGGLEPDGSP